MRESWAKNHDQLEEKWHFLILSLPSLLAHTPFTKEGGGMGGYLKNRCPHEHEILWGNRDIFQRLRNVEDVYIVITWLP